MSKHEFIGKNTEDAINEGLRKLGCTISDVKVEVLDEGAKGLFGFFGSKQARVLLTLEETGDDALSALSSMTLDSFGDKPQKKRKAEYKPAAVQEPEKTAAPEDMPPHRQAGASASVHEKAQVFLEELTRLMNIPTEVDIKSDSENNLLIQLIGDSQGTLIGRRGETLDAMQYLTSLLINQGSESYIRVTLDAENYRAKREDSLRRLASRMATRAYKTGRKVAIEPMNPYERRILHASLQNHPHVTTHSEGDEPNRHVVITLKDNTPH